MAKIGTYEQSCIDYALFGNPTRDASDYELNAQYDQHDGHRMDFKNDYAWEQLVEQQEYDDWFNSLSTEFQNYVLIEEKNRKEEIEQRANNYITANSEDIPF